LFSAVGWGGMSFIMGWLIDAFGVNSMFAGFFVIQFVNVSLIVFFMPAPEHQKSANDGPSMWEVISRFDVMWFFSNLFIYGVCMCLIENFLFVYMVQDFHPPPPTLMLGLSTTVMCAFEIPVFKYISPWLERNREEGAETPKITIVLVMCQLITAIRCWLYAIMPNSMAWLVLVIGSLQGISFAAMWVASMEYANRLSSPTTLAKMTSLVNGLYYSVSMGVGSLMWGFLVEEDVLGFRPSFNWDAVVMTTWAVIWLGGKCMCSRAAPTDPELNAAVADS